MRKHCAQQQGLPARGPVAKHCTDIYSCTHHFELVTECCERLLYFSNERFLLHIRRALILTSVQNSSRIGCGTVVATSGKGNTTNSQDDHCYQATRSHFSLYVTICFYFCLDLQTIILLYSLKTYRRCRNKGYLYPSSGPGEQNF